MLARFAKWILNIRGWQIVGQPPQVNHYVIIGAPHTSNWDFYYFILLKFYFRLKVSFFGKRSIFFWPLGPLLVRLGGIPVDRSKSHNLVDAIVSEFQNSQQLIVAIAPEGTRAYREYWKSGFYHIAVQADVPVQICFIDSARQEVGFGPLIQLSGNIEQDLTKFKAFYQDKKGINPAFFGKIVFKSETNEFQSPCD
ncbi:lysophospholipid acyltransferase family protein [Aliikangiella maris]|uniref:Lysophospholipid acyltransferase family protein n=2 Tax=Aliikangiella maris TaxID=3162458 RepID=A0ABV3MLV8_9GAMM